jgi:hypothetical protein
MIPNAGSPDPTQSDWWQQQVAPAMVGAAHIMPAGPSGSISGAMMGAANAAAGQASGAPTGAAPGAATGSTATGNVLDQLKSIVGNDWSPAHLQQIWPQIQALGIHIQNESRGDYRPRFLLPNGETWDYGPGGWVGRGNIGNWHEGGGEGGAGSGTGSNPQSALENTPGYQFSLQQGLQAVQRSAAARGTLLTGGTLQRLQQVGSGLASQNYDDEVRRRLQAAQLGLGATGAGT